MGLHQPRPEYIHRQTTMGSFVRNEMEWRAATIGVVAVSGLAAFLLSVCRGELVRTGECITTHNRRPRIHLGRYDV